MPQQKHFRALIQTWTVSGTLLAASLSGIISHQAWAQADLKPPSVSATDHAPSVVNLRDTAQARSITPQEVTNGTASVLGRYNPDAKLRLVLGLNPPKMQEEERFLQQLQEKKSPLFHKYLTAQQWNARFGPTEQQEQAVVDWATSNGLTITQRYPNRLIVDVEGTSATIEKAFGVQINSYQVGANVEFSNDREPVIPANLVGILQSVGGLNSIQRARAPHEGNIREKSVDYSAGPVSTVAGAQRGDGNKAAYEAAVKAAAKKAKSSGVEKDLPKPITNGYIDPTDIYSSYGYDFNALQAQGHCCNPLGNSGGSPNTTSIAIATAGEFADSDWTGFHNQYPYLAWNYDRVWVDGTPSCCNDETTLDMEWAIATANSFGSYLDTSHVRAYIGANNLLSTFTDVYNQMLSDNNERVFSTSWGCAEITCSNGSAMNTDHAIFNSMLGQGWTIMALSHDYGATGGCDDALRVTYPASDPDVVAVGGTSLALYGDGTFASETAWEGSTSSGSCSHNAGGSGGGCSAYWSAPSYQNPAYCGSGSRSVPDISLNAGYGQNYYFNGSLGGVGGTSISTPQVAGFMAQADAYLLAIGLGGAPMGLVNYQLYYVGETPGYAAHYPYYDITVGCNNNDITQLYGLGYYCAGTGYDAVTGWGSFNALQLSWAIGTYDLGDFGAPVITFSGPAGVNSSSDTWFNTDQTVSWTVADTTNGCCTATGVAGFSQAWDNYFTDPTSEATQGTGNSFYSGPQFPNATSGYLQLSWAGQGCHYATVDAWDNTGISSGNNYFYWICYDTVAPSSSASLSGTVVGSVYASPVNVTITSTDPSPGSGISATYYQLDGGALQTYGGTFTVSATGHHVLAYYSRDVAGNYSTTQSVGFWIKSPTTTVVASSVNPSVFHQSVTFTATVTASFGSTPLGNVAFKNNGVVVATVALSGGVASYTTSALALGSHTIVAVYETSGKDIASVSAAITQTVNKAGTTTTVTSSVNPSSWHQAVTFTATVHGAFGGLPTGTVTFKNGTAVLGTGTLNASGVATLTATALTVGVHSITVAYPGDTDFTASTSSPLAQTVNKAATTTTLVSSLNPSNHGQAVTFTATIAPAFGGAVTGTVNFKDGATIIGTGAVNAAKKATFTTSTLTVGTHSISAVYTGNTNLKSSFSTAVKQVVK
jgi:hypothetical protein